MPNCTATQSPQTVEFGRLGRRVVEGRFDGGSMTSDAGVMLLGATDRKLGLIEAAARCIADPRSPLLTKHAVVDMLRQRVYGLALGWEDLNDHAALIFRGDSGFCRQRIINYCERADVNYIMGLARNPRLQGITEFLELAMKEEFQTTGRKQREVGEFVYAAETWAKERRVITRLEYGEQGNNPRYVVTNLTGEPQTLYDDLYCQRGEAENRIKEAQVGLFATRTSCQHFQSNQLRMLLAALGYVLIERLRALALHGTALATAQVDTLRIKLLKLAAVVTRNTRRIRLYLASNWPSADIFAHAMSELRSP